MSLSKRIAAIEVQAAPALERAKKRRQWVKLYFNTTKIDFDEAYRYSQYVGEPRTRQQFINSMAEHGLFSYLFRHKLYKNIEQISEEQWQESQNHASIFLVREWYGREITLDESSRELEIFKQAKADFLAGIPPEQSEAALYCRNLFAQYPLLKNESDAMTEWSSGMDIKEWFKRWMA
jgi:hypothetical protein